MTPSSRIKAFIKARREIAPSVNDLLLTDETKLAMLERLLSYVEVSAEDERDYMSTHKPAHKCLEDCAQLIGDGE